MLGRFAREMKDGALTLALKTYFNEKFKNYGEILVCEVDTVRCSVNVEARLLGEDEPISATLERYELVREGMDFFVIPHSFKSSRQWLTRLLNSLFGGKRFQIPAAIGALLL